MISLAQDYTYEFKWITKNITEDNLLENNGTNIF